MSDNTSQFATDDAIGEEEGYGDRVKIKYITVDGGKFKHESVTVIRTRSGRMDASRAEATRTDGEVKRKAKSRDSAKAHAASPANVERAAEPSSVSIRPPSLPVLDGKPRVPVSDTSAATKTNMEAQAGTKAELDCPNAEATGVAP